MVTALAAAALPEGLRRVRWQPCPRFSGLDESVPYGATTWFESIAPRWVRDHDPLYMQGRSVVNTSAGFRSATDVLVRLGPGDSKEIVWTGEHFDQSIKLTLGGSSNHPAAASERATITGISPAQVWTPTRHEG